MKLLLGLVIALVLTGCSTVGVFKVPKGTDLYVGEQMVMPEQYNMYKRSPFSWGNAAGIRYALKKDGKLVEEGTLKSKFRVASIFWPPVALAYWPMGFANGVYDFTQPNMLVRPKK